MKQRPLWLANALLLLALAGAFWGRRSESAIQAPKDFIRPLSLPFRGWSHSDQAMEPEEAEMLEPDAFLVRRYLSPDKKETAELAVVAGHQKRTVHTPGFCMSGGGWEMVAQREHQLDLGGGRSVPAVRALLTKEGRHLLSTYFFTDGELATPSLVRLQGAQLLARVKGELPMGALVRILVPVNRDGPASERLADDLARATTPQILETLRRVRGKA